MILNCLLSIYEITKTNKYIISDNQDVITSAINENNGNVIVHNLSNCIMYESEHDKFDSTYIDYNFEISPDLNNTHIVQYLMDIEAKTIRNT